MLSFGLTFITVNILYILFSALMGFIAYKLYKLKKVGFIIFFIVLILPFYDLLIQKGIKTYYETFKMDNTIYAYPERDADGKIESLGVWREARQHTSSYLWDQKNLMEFREKLSGVSGFVEYYFFGSSYETINSDGTRIIKRDYKKDFGYARVYLKETPIRYEKLKNKSELKARYQVKTRNDSGQFFDKTIIEYWDTKENKFLATSFKLDFYTKDYDQKFRNKYLLWRGPSGVAFSVKNIHMFHHQVNNKLFFNSKSKNK